VRWLRRHYGAHPIHLLLMFSCFAVAGYALTRIKDQGGLFRILLWFVLALVVHDLIGWPIYTWADRVLLRVSQRRTGRPRPQVPWINHIRVPAFISGVLLIVALPLILRLSAGSYAAITGVSESGYFRHWLLVTAVLFAGSALLYGVRLGLAQRRPSRDGSSG
jgi:FtsH-binding integral membrane protein